MSSASGCAGYEFAAGSPWYESFGRMGSTADPSCCGAAWRVRFGPKADVGGELFLLRIANLLFTTYQREGKGERNWAERMTVWERQLRIRIGADGE
jgi:hypothetical protein